MNKTSFTGWRCLCF